MALENRIDAFHELGNYLRAISPAEKEALLSQTANENPWFNGENTILALTGISKFLDRHTLGEWLDPYSFKSPSKKVGVAMAGNIPLVGFHDLMCVLLSGHHLIAKLSSNDSVLMKFIRDLLINIDPSFKSTIFFEERLNGVDAVIATGSDNTSRYFEYYFRNIPHIIRKNRTSCAVILGEESADEFSTLGKDVFSYFGLGCRNVSKIYVPEKFEFPRMLKSWESFQPIINHHKYANNYDYQKSILLINQIHFYDSGFVLLTQNENLVSPISTVYYEFYKDQNDLNAKLEMQKEKIQCTVSAKGWFKGSVPFGEAQFPSVSDYADGVDTMSFLQAID
jgi:hypothetical protein